MTLGGSFPSKDPREKGAQENEVKIVLDLGSTSEVVDERASDTKAFREHDMIVTPVRICKTL